MLLLDQRTYKRSTGNLFSYSQVKMEGELRALFKAADKDGNGTLSREEIMVMILKESHKFFFTEKDVEGALQKMDADSDGKITCQGKKNSGFFKIINFNLFFISEFITVIKNMFPFPDEIK